MIKCQFQKGEPAPIVHAIVLLGNTFPGAPGAPEQIDGLAVNYDLFWCKIFRNRQRHEPERRAFPQGMQIVARFLWRYFPPRHFAGTPYGRGNNKMEEGNASRPRFTDVTAKLGWHYQNDVSHYSRKYLIETMGPGVALSDYDNDLRLDIFVVNGAPPEDPLPKGTIPEKTGSKTSESPLS